MALGVLVVALSLAGVVRRIVRRTRSVPATVEALGPGEVVVGLESASRATVRSKLELMVGDRIRVHPRAGGHAVYTTPRARLAIPFLAYGIGLVCASFAVPSREIPLVLLILPSVLGALLVLYAGFVIGRITFAVRETKTSGRII